MNNKDFKQKFLVNLRNYLPERHKDVKIVMRIAKEGERCYYDEAEKSVRKVVYRGVVWRIETKSEINKLSELIYLALYKTLDVTWEYKGKAL